jgi:glycerol-3-phosphate dehydrogenase
VTRDYVLEVEPARPTPDVAPMLTVFGGKITTYRKLAEQAASRLAPFFEGMAAAWTGQRPLPGGDMADGDFEGFLTGLQQAYPWLPVGLARHYARLYGTRAGTLLGDATGIGSLGRHLGGLLYSCEVDYLCRVEWACTAEDILQRRTKHGLHLSADERRSVEVWLRDRQPAASARAPTAPAVDTAAPGSLTSAGVARAAKG